MNLSVIIPVYKNTENFIKNLSHNISFLVNCEIIVINDDPKESISEKIKIYPSIMLIENKRNKGFSGTINIGVNKAKNDYVMLLNSDVILINNNFEKALSYFRTNKQLFSVSFSQQEKNNKFVGKNRIYWKKGMIWHDKSHDFTFGKNAWAEGGACIIDKKKLLLDGFDEEFYPFYWEDIDISYRAWKAGYEILFDPSIRVIHHHESTIKTYFPKNEIQTISYKNQFLFIWNNISDWKLLIEHIFYLPYYAIYYILRFDLSFFQGFFSAFLKLPSIILKRKKRLLFFTKSDKTILSYFV